MKHIKGIFLIAALILTGCASVPLPPHCDDTGKDLKPINAISGTKFINATKH